MTASLADTAIVQRDLAARLRAQAAELGSGSVAELLEEAANAAETAAEDAERPRRPRREKSTAELIGAARRMMRAVVERIERDGDVTAWAELDRFVQHDAPKFVDQGAAHLLGETWGYATQQLADERGCSKQNIHKRFGRHVTRKPGAQPLRLR